MWWDRERIDWYMRAASRTDFHRHLATAIENHLGSKPAEGCVARNERHLHIPMAAFGEAICKVRDTCRDDIMQTMTEMTTAA